MVLGALLEADGGEVSRDELRRRLWPDQSFLDFENGINTAVARLRQALGDSADNPRFIGTRPRHGYRWLTPIQWPVPLRVAQATALAEARTTALPGKASRRSAPSWWLLAGPAVILAIGLMAGGKTLARGVRALRPATERPQSWDIPAPPGASLTGSFALSPKGTYVVAAISEGAPERSRLWLRSVASLAWSPLAGTEGAAMPFWSPDEQSLGFFAQGKLKTIEIQSGAISTLTDAPRGRGGSWSPKGMILFAPEVNNSIHAIPARGGPVAAVTELRDAPSHRFPVFLPDGERFLYLALREDRDRSEIRWGRLAGLEGGRVAMANSGPVFTDSHYVLFARGGALLSLSVDMTTLDPEGRPTVIGDVGVYGEEGPTGLGAFSAASDGALATMALLRPPLRLVWIDRLGRTRLAGGPRAAYTEMDLCRDGARLAAVRTDARRRSSDLVVIDLRSGVESEVTNDAYPDARPVWTPACDAIVFSSLRGGNWSAWRQDAQTRGKEPEKIAGCAEVLSFFPDGSVVCRGPSTESPELWRVPLDSARKGALLVTVKTTDPPQATVSPDGSRLAYSSVEGGRRMLFLDDLRPGSEGRPIGLGTGENPKWRSDGEELYFLSSGRLMAVTVTSRSPMAVSDPGPLIEAPPVANDALTDFAPQFAAAPDGSEFLFAVPVQDEPVPTIHYVRPWIAETDNRASKSRG